MKMKDLSEWSKQYALLALRIQRIVSERGGILLIYHGPLEWRDAVNAENLMPANQLADDADSLLRSIPFSAPRGNYLEAQFRAMGAAARQLAGDKLPLAAYVEQCLGFTPRKLPESLFEEAHSMVDDALPSAPLPLPKRLQEWRKAHTLTDRKKIPGIIERTIAEARRRTDAIIRLPEGESMDIQTTENPFMLAGGLYRGNLKSTFFYNDSLPVNLADLLYTVTHESYPGHITEAMLKEKYLVQEKGFWEQQIQFMTSPQFVITEGIGLCAEEMVFPRDEAQEWLERNVFINCAVRGAHGDISMLHRAKNILWGVWSNAAFLADEGASDSEITEYLAKWSLLEDAELATALAYAKSFSPYIFCYYYGWERVQRFIGVPGRADRIRRLLTEQLLPGDLMDCRE